MARSVPAASSPHNIETDNATPRRYVIGCRTCGCLRVQWESWTDANRQTIVDDCGEGVWCPRCEETTHRGSFVLERVVGGWREVGRGRGVPLRESIRRTRRVGRFQRKAEIDRG